MTIAHLYNRSLTKYSPVRSFNTQRNRFSYNITPSKLSNRLGRRGYSDITKAHKDDSVASKHSDSPDTFEYSDTVKCTKDQWLYKPTAKEVRLFLDSKPIPARPFDLDHSVVVKLVDLDKDVTSPVRNSVYFSEYGVRKGERLRIAIAWLLFASTTTYLGVWQLRRKKWKEGVLESRKKSLSMPAITLSTLAPIKDAEVSSDAPDEDNPLLYRIVEAHGVLDTKQQFLVGPRQSLTHDYGDQVGYYLLCPLRFSDGSAILINMGWLKGDEVMDLNIGSEWVTVRGVLVPGEISEKVIPSIKFKFLSALEALISTLTNSQVVLTKAVNRPADLMRNDSRKVYRYLDPHSMASQMFSTEPSVARKYLISVYDSYFDDDRASLEKEIEPSKDSLLSRVIKRSGITFGRPSDPDRPGPERYKFQRKQKSDYLLFYADPGTHFNYAMQWFLMGLSVTCLCIYKLVRVNRVLKNLASNVLK